MKELHNHIFSNTTCISKETMLRYINKQLSKKELYEVEKHMLDCELCTDAFEGMKMATNSSVLFAIDNKIDLRVGSGAKKPSIFRNLMIAASIVLIAFGTFFTVKNFNDTLNNDELAITETTPFEEEKAIAENFINATIENEENNYQKNEVKASLSDEAKSLNNTIEKTEASPVFAEEIVVSLDEVQEFVVDKDEVQITSDDVMEDEIEEVSAPLMSAANKRMGNDNNVAGNTSASVTRNESFSAVTMDVVQDVEQNERIRDKKKSKARKSEKLVPAAVTEMNKGNVAYENTNTYDIYTYKIYDYAVAYQNEYEFDKTMEQEVMSSDFETKNNKAEAKKELENNTIEITYKKTLEDAVKALKNNEYQVAIRQFDVILKAHPKDVNALFYSGIAMYNLNQFKSAQNKFDKVLINKQTTFNQEAKWYLAKSNVELNDTKKAKKILQEIIDENGFYKNQAIKLLEELNK